MPRKHKPEGIIPALDLKYFGLPFRAGGLGSGGLLQAWCCAARVSKLVALDSACLGAFRHI